MNSGYVARLTACHAKVLILAAKKYQPQLKDALDSFLAYGGNIFWRNSNWGTILTLIMRHGASFECICEYLFRQPEPWTVNDLLPIDRWLVGILQHTDSKFRKALQRYLASYRTVFFASEVYPSLGAVFNIEVIVSEVQEASTRDRVEFLKVVSKWGTKDMIVPFIRAGFDLDEKFSNEQMPWLRLSYLSKAVKWGNLDTFETLLGAGACPTQALIYLSRHPGSLPPCKYPASRKQMILALVERAEPRHLEESEGLLSFLLRTDDVRTYCPAAADWLIDRFILQRHDIIGRKSQELLNSYVLAIILLDIPQILQYFYRSGFRINGNELIGKVLGGQRVLIKGDVVGKYTWLTFAIHLGRASCVKLLIENGADYMKVDPCGRIGLHMVKDYVSGPHPRAATELYIWPYQPPQRFVSVEDDEETLATLQSTTGTQPGVDFCSEYESGNDSGTRVTDRMWSQLRSELYVISRCILLLTNDVVSVAFAVQPLEILAKVIEHNSPTIKLWVTAARLSSLTFTEALGLRIGYVASLIALLFYGIIDLLLHVGNLASVFDENSTVTTSAAW